MNAAFLTAAGYGYFTDRSRSSPGVGHPFNKAHHFYEMLELTQAQSTQMHPLATSFHEQLDRLHADMAVKKASMISILRGENAEDDRVEILRREMAAIQDRIQKTVIAHIFDVEAILNSDQRERFFDLLHESMRQERAMFIPSGEK
jgi:Spy/CpxP family protein refolding chaperone